MIAGLRESEELAKLRHDLRTPINHILGYGEMVAEELAELGRKDLVADLERVSGAARQLLELIDGNLREGGKPPVDRTDQTDRTDPTDPVEVRSGPILGHLLVVDDSAGNREMLVRRLGREGYTTEEAGDGAEALAMMRERAFDLVLLDVMMPGVDGYEALREMKQDRELRHIPVIMISALDELASVVRCIEAGAEDYLPKPFEPALLRARIGASLEKKTLRDQERDHLRTIEQTQARLAAELNEAANYVRSIFPAPTTTPYRIDWAYEPSGELGGDAFGYHWIDDEHFAIYLLDVCGHGVGAALLSVAAINVIRSASLPETDFRQPGEVLAGLNGAFQMEEQNNMYFTIWYGVLHAPTGRLRHAAGGHPPALLLRANGELEQVLSSGLLIGAMEGTAYAAGECQLETGDRLFVLCDGTYELKRPEAEMIEFGEFEAFVRDVGRAPDGLTQILNWAREVRAGEPLEDDFSIVRLEV